MPSTIPRMFSRKVMCDARRRVAVYEIFVIKNDGCVIRSPIDIVAKDDAEALSKLGFIRLGDDRVELREGNRLVARLDQAPVNA